MCCIAAFHRYGLHELLFFVVHCNIIHVAMFFPRNVFAVVNQLPVVSLYAKLG